MAGMPASCGLDVGISKVQRGPVSGEDSGAKMRPEDIAFLERAWLAWHSMPRQANGKPPSWRSIELEHNLAEGTFSKMFKGQRREHGLVMYERLSRALRTEVLWLVHGVGTAPQPTGTVPPRGEPVERSGVEKTLSMLRHGLLRAGVPLVTVRATVRSASEALHANAGTTPSASGHEPDRRDDVPHRRGDPGLVG